MAGPMSGGDKPLTEINIIPFVDIVLVLLIIFMLTAPVMFDRAIPLELPQAATGEADSGRELGITILADGAILLDGDRITREALRAEVRDAPAESRALIAADKTTPHGDVVGVLDLLREAGIERYAINVIPADGAESS